MEELAAESGETQFLMPVGLCSVIDRENGGDATAAELISRFNLLDFESRNVIDFYFLGWSKSPELPSPLRFDLVAFERFQLRLRDFGIPRFGGNADLVLVDAEYSSGKVALNFPEAIRVDLSRGAIEKGFPSLGPLLESIVEAAEQVKAEATTVPRHHGIVYSISDILGLAIAKKSILSYFLEKWGKIIGATTLEAVAVRNLGPKIDLHSFPGFLDRSSGVMP